jgi:hypothetical protein
LSQEALDLLLLRPGVLSSNADARHLTGEFVQFQSNPEPLVARHLAITLDLHLRGGFWTHGENLPDGIRASNEEFWRADADLFLVQEPTGFYPW